LPEIITSNTEDHYTNPINEKNRLRTHRRYSNPDTKIYNDIIEVPDKNKIASILIKDDAKNKDLVISKSKISLKAKDNKNVEHNIKEPINKAKDKKRKDIQKNNIKETNTRKSEVDTNSVRSKPESGNSNIAKINGDHKTKSERSKVEDTNKKYANEKKINDNIKLKNNKVNNIKENIKNDIKKLIEEKIKDKEDIKERNYERNYERISKKSQSNNQTIEHKNLYIEKKTTERSNSPAITKRYNYWKNIVKKWHMPSADERKTIELEILKMRLQKEPKPNFNFVKLSKLTLD